MSRIDEELKRIKAELNEKFDDQFDDIENDIEEGIEGGFDGDFDEDEIDDFDVDSDDDFDVDSDDEPEDDFVEENDEAVSDSYHEEAAEAYGEESFDDYEDDYDESLDEDYEEDFEDSYETQTTDRNAARNQSRIDPRNDPRNELERFADEPEEYVDYYGIEQKRPSKKIVPKEQEKTRSLRMKRYKEQSLARYSNIYMIAGVFIGIAIFFFIVSPELKNSYNERLREVETKYNKTLSTKNNEIDNLKQEVDGLTAKNEEYANAQAAMQTNIDNLTNEVEMLKKNVENNGMMVATTTDAIVASGTDATSLPKGIAVPNAAAERNNANVIGISRTAIEEMIKHE